MLAAIFSALAEASNLILDKITLTRERLSLRIFLPLLFIFLFAITATLAPVLGRFDEALVLLPNTLFSLFLMIALAISSNVLFYQSIQREKTQHHELMMMLMPLMTVLLTAVFYPQGLDWRIFGLALFASVALIFARGEKEHFFVNHTSYNTFLAVILASAEVIITKELLYSFTPVALYAVRTFFIAIFFMAYYRPRYSQISGKHWWLVGFSAAIGVVQMLGRYYAYSELGIVYTTLVTALAPIIIFLASWEILHEKIRPRVIISSVIIVVCVIIATVLTFNK